MSQPPYQNQSGPGNFPPGGPGNNYPPGGPGNNYPQGGYNAPMDRGMITTGLEFGGYKIVRYLGVVRGLTVRSRSVLGNIGAGFQSLVGGKITIYVELCEHAREEAFNLMMQHASQVGANAIVGMRYDANEVADGITEVLAYGTAVVVQPDKR
ncbi:MAG: hypothetical protein JWP00_4266 [Chloroflexi bacterium]|jgi:uncharacterized protein YbjQ (UPF0145 family)|nr:hypothetical protein [Chloroflexota bacterium]